MQLEGKRIGFVFTGSFCTFRKTIEELKKIVKAKAKVIPIMSEHSYTKDTKFGNAIDFINEIENTKIYYFKLYKVFETQDYFYLYLDEDTAFLVSKSGFKIGTPKDFSEFIKKKCIFKYSKEK